ncbi:hypothetical protein [Pseudomonas sp. PB103]|nr:hypothetical protein [Pseudomonas sp. PB103]
MARLGNEWCDLQAPSDLVQDQAQRKKRRLSCLDLEGSAKKIDDWQV